MHNQEASIPEFCVARQNHFLPLIFFTYPLDFAEKEGLPVIQLSELCFELHSLKSLTEGFCLFLFSSGNDDNNDDDDNKVNANAKNDNDYV